MLSTSIEEEDLKHEWVPSREIQATVDIKGTAAGEIEEISLTPGISRKWEGKYELPFSREIREYLAGERTRFSFLGSCKKRIQRVRGKFYRAVLNKTMDIPYGETMSYSQVAKSLNSRAFRATGSALSLNPVVIAIPCHRVVGKRGIGGFGGGVSIKRKLLKLEGADGY